MIEDPIVVPAYILNVITKIGMFAKHIFAQNDMPAELFTHEIVIILQELALRGLYIIDIGSVIESKLREHSRICVTIDDKYAIIIDQIGEQYLLRWEAEREICDNLDTPISGFANSARVYISFITDDELCRVIATDIIRYPQAATRIINNFDLNIQGFIDVLYNDVYLEIQSNIVNIVNIIIDYDHKELLCERGIYRTEIFLIYLSRICSDAWKCMYYSTEFYKYFDHYVNYVLNSERSIADEIKLLLDSR